MGARLFETDVTGVVIVCEADPLSDGLTLILSHDLDTEDRYKELIETVGGILAHEPDHSTALYYLCEAYAYTGRLNDADNVQQRFRRLRTARDPAD